MKIEEILALDPEEIVKKLKLGRQSDEIDVTKYMNALNPIKHDIYDEVKRPKKEVQREDGSKYFEDVARIGLSMQKLIVKRSASFLFGNEVKLSAETTTANHEKILNAVKEILKHVKIKSLNRRMAKVLLSCTEVAEVWYPVDNITEKNLYGIDSKFKLRVKILNPLKGDKLYPYFDEFGDLIAFSREFEVHVDEIKRIYFEVYTDKAFYVYDITDNPVMIEGYPKLNEIGKIPVVYTRIEQSDFEDVQPLINRLEKVLSNFADTNDYHGSPTIVVKGKLKGFAKKGETGKILETDGTDADVKYLEWSHAPESVKVEIETLLSLINTLSQNPDISFNNLKGSLGNISGRAMELLFMDAHLKVEDYLEVLDEYLERRVNIIKAFIGSFNKSLYNDISTLSIESDVTPFIINDDKESIEVLMTATGNKAILSQETAVGMSGLVIDAKSEFEKIKSEQESSSIIDMFPQSE